MGLVDIVTQEPEERALRRERDKAIHKRQLWNIFHSFCTVAFSTLTILFPIPFLPWFVAPLVVLVSVGWTTHRSFKLKRMREDNNNG